MGFFRRFKETPCPGWVVLNAIRAINIIAFLACIIASFSMLVKTFVVSKFFFFDGVSHLITAILSILLLITECSIFKRYIAVNWPLLSPSSGFVTLGVFMVVIGVSILGNLNKTATSQDSLGTPFWRIVIASGIITCVMGVVNVAVSYYYRKPALGITARQVRSHGASANQKVYFPPPSSSVYSSPAMSAKPTNARRSFHLNPSVRRSVTISTLPSYHQDAKPTHQPIRNISAPIGSGARNPDLESGTTPIHNEFVARGTGGGGYGNEKTGSWDEGFAPVVEGVQRPDLAHHPALQGGRF